MKYQVLFAVVAFSLVANTGLAQEMNPAAVDNVVGVVESDSSMFHSVSPMGDWIDTLLSDDGWYYGMPILKPGYVDAKMKTWWPSTDYNYNMPNAFPGKENKFQFNYPGNKN